MNQHVALRPATSMNSGTDPRVLGTIAMPGVAVAIWHPEPDTDWQGWLDALPAAQLPRMRQALRPQDATAAVIAACDAAGLPDGPFRARLIARIAGLAEQAARHMGALLVTLRLEVSDSQACPKWHMDGVRARLLSTLRGAGTQFGPASGPAEVARQHHLPTGAAALFRGRNWGPEQTGILHRSPPAVAGQTRLVVVIDPVDEAASC